MKISSLGHMAGRVDSTSPSTSSPFQYSFPRSTQAAASEQPRPWGSSNRATTPRVALGPSRGKWAELRFFMSQKAPSAPRGFRS